MLRWRPCPHRAGIVASIALLLLPALYRHHHPRRVGVFALVVLERCPRCTRVATSIAAWRLPRHDAVATRAAVIASRALSSLPALRWRRRHVARASSPLLRWHCCPRCTLDFDGPVEAALASLSAWCWRPCPHCAGIIASIALLSLPALRRRCHLVGLQADTALAFAGVALASLPASCWRPCQHCPVIVAGVAPALSPLARGRPALIACPLRWRSPFRRHRRTWRCSVISGPLGGGPLAAGLGWGWSPGFCCRGRGPS